MSHWKHKPSESSEMSEVNMTPLIDVSLVLVVILLLATPLAFESSFGIRRTTDTARAAEAPTEDERIEVTILAPESIRVNQSVVTLADLGLTLVPLIERSHSGTVAVTCQDTIPHGTFVRVLDTVKLSGALEIAVAGR
jgi:biopolymer transport protein ExbD